MLLSRHQNGDENQEIKNSKQIVEKYVTVQIFGDDSNKPTFDSGEN
jgi:hypothetical protein